MRHITVLAAFSLLAACGGGGAGSAGTAAKATVRDSSGVAIWEYSAAGWAAAPELKLSTRPLTTVGGEEGERWGFFNRLVEPAALLAQAQALARDLAAGPTFANGITKTMLHQEWSMTIEQAIEAEAQAQALCMLTEDFKRAYNAFVAKQKPVFEGN